MKCGSRRTSLSLFKESNFEYVQNTIYCGKEAETNVFVYHDATGLTVDTDIMARENKDARYFVQQSVITTLPDEEGIKLRDYLISIYPL